MFIYVMGYKRKISMANISLSDFFPNSEQQVGYKLYFPTRLISLHFISAVFFKVSV